ncbi:hypothetical protein H2198_006533 [Neophaeococcomyces mojaviensis]|uniref:Uncharacterized protein n=1 Tax=Neophaeococcomyces mojaviensis TaxID=3383035 RepID=A0ACC3A2S9_9EURO|nr:hypothetical protein H2198_006533 [Knufia sp. JES_112]
MAVPNPDTMRAFGVDGTPTPLLGGRGLCYRVGDTVLRPSDNDDETNWIARVLHDLPSSAAYRISQPKAVAAEPTNFIHNGWTAWSFLPGEAGVTPRFADILRVSRVFHTDIASLDLQKPQFLEQRTNRWHEADLVTWGEKRLEDIEKVNEEILALFQPMLEKLQQIKRPLPANLSYQVIHADLTGNVLFDDDAPPGIIDITPYWRPAEYAEAIIVADGLVWHGEGQDLIEIYGMDDVRLQLLVRAVYWRCITFAIDTDVQWVQQHVAKADFQGALDIIHDLIGK